MYASLISSRKQHLESMNTSINTDSGSSERLYGNQWSFLGICLKREFLPILSQLLHFSVGGHFCQKLALCFQPKRGQQTCSVIPCSTRYSWWRCSQLHKAIKPFDLTICFKFIIYSLHKKQRNDVVSKTFSKP